MNKAEYTVYESSVESGQIWLFSLSIKYKYYYLLFVIISRDVPTSQLTGKSKKDRTLVEYKETVIND